LLSRKLCGQDAALHNLLSLCALCLCGLILLIVKYKLFNFARRLGLFLLVVWTVVSLVTLLIELVPGDPAAAILGDQATPEQIEAFRVQHGLDKPAFFFSVTQNEGFKWNGFNNRYTEYWGNLLQGDLGKSFLTDKPVLGMIAERYPYTILLAVASMIVAVSIAIPLGILAGTNKGKITDNFASIAALLGISLPGFVIGPVLVYLFAVQVHIFTPTFSAGTFSFQDIWGDPAKFIGDFFSELIPNIILPAFTLGAAMSAILTRMVRSSVIEELGEDYVRTARAKGLSDRVVVYKHVLKNGLIPVVTILGLQLGILLAGAIITEKIFGWPGLGLLLLEDGIGKRDYRLVQGCVLVISVTYILANMLTDWMYRWLDPRIRLS
jgi:ABC-type dipeptide/oligopeptide/nickel transport system permease component